MDTGITADLHVYAGTCTLIYICNIATYPWWGGIDLVYSRYL